MRGLQALVAAMLAAWGSGAEGRGTVEPAGAAALTARGFPGPVSSLAGELASVGGVDVPAAFALRATRRAGVASGTTGQPPLMELALRCSVERRRWRCPVPAGTWDLELRPAGFVPHYFWDVSLLPGRETSLGQLVLRSGGSIAGALAGPDGSPPAGPCRVEVPPLGFSVPAGPRGFFQLSGLPPGSHVVEARCPGARASRAVAVRADSETRIPGTLVLRALTLAVRVVPPLDPARRPWRLHVFDASRGRRPIATGESVSPEGRWQRSDLPAGAYQVDLVREGGSQWLSRHFELTEASGWLTLEAPALRLSGLVLLGARPLRASLRLSDDGGSLSVPLESGEDGRFEGHVPATREVREAGWSVEVHAASPPVNHRLEGVVIPGAFGDEEAWLDVVVPGAAARGTVLAEDGTPQEGAQVLCEALEGRARSYAARTDERGCFELAGLPAGSYRVTAEGPHGSSKPQQVTIGDGLEPELRLVLERRKRLLLGEVHAGGRPVAGAVAHVWISPGLSQGSAVTDARGRFEVTVPSDAQEVGLTVAARGHALKMARVAVAGTRPIVIPLDGAAGTLLIEAPSDPGLLERPAGVVLAHGGTVESVEVLADWGAQNGGGREGDRIVVPDVVPGTYSLCWALPREIPALWAGTAGPGLCRTGSLTAGGSLSLSLPPLP